MLPIADEQIASLKQNDRDSRSIVLEGGIEGYLTRLKSSKETGTPRLHDRAFTTEKGVTMFVDGPNPTEKKGFYSFEMRANVPEKYLGKISPEEYFAQVHRAFKKEFPQSQIAPWDAKLSMKERTFSEEAKNGAQRTRTRKQVILSYRYNTGAVDEEELERLWKNGVLTEASFGRAFENAWVGGLIQLTHNYRQGLEGAIHQVMMYNGIVIPPEEISPSKAVELSKRGYGMK